MSGQSSWKVGHIHYLVRASGVDENFKWTDKLYVGRFTDEKRARKKFELLTRTDGVRGVAIEKLVLETEMSYLGRSFRPMSHSYRSEWSEHWRRPKVGSR